MAQPIEFKHVPASSSELLQRKLEAAPLQNAEALLKAYALLDMAEKHGLLDLLRGAISAENAILDKVAGYANTPEGINTMRNLLVMGKLLGTVEPDVLSNGAREITASVVTETKKPASGLFAITRRIFGGDALRGLAITIAALESVGRVSRERSEKLGTGK